MKAVVYNKREIPDRLIYCDVEKPLPGDDELLIKIVAVSVNAADYRSMKMGLIPKKKIFGADIAGRVESVGKDISKFKPGDEVMGDLASYGFGGFAEYAAAPEKALVLKPPNVPFEDAASLPMAGLTALQALCNKGNIQKGQKVLIVGSSGGVGTFAVQLAAYFGAEVTAVCSAKNTEQAISLGADHVIDYSIEPIGIKGRKFDLILAVNGSYKLSTYKQLLNPGGTSVMVGGSLAQIFKFMAFGWLFSIGSKKFRILAAKANQKDLEFLAKLTSDGKIKPVVERLYPLEKTAEAMQYLSQGHARGKIVIKLE